LNVIAQGDVSHGEEDIIICACPPLGGHAQLTSSSRAHCPHPCMWRERMRDYLPFVKSNYPLPRGSSLSAGQCMAPGRERERPPGRRSGGPLEYKLRGRERERDFMCRSGEGVIPSRPAIMAWRGRTSARRHGKGIPPPGPANMVREGEGH